MNIPDKAVEAALRVAIFEDCGDMSVLAAMVPEERAVWEENVRAELEAAAPLIAAHVLQEASANVSPYDAATLLNMADRFEEAR